jgi:ABC-type nitrate/sulfonate/bicarbonate transport system permease component
LRSERADWLERQRGAAPVDTALDGRGARAAAAAVGVLGALGVWQLVAVAGWLPQHSFPRASTVVGDLVSSLGERATWDAVAATMEGWAWGLAIAVPAAVVAGMVIGSSDVLFDMVRPIVEFLRPVPSVALIPVGVLLFGVELEVKVFLVAYAVFFPTLYQAIYGVRSTNRVALETASVYGLGRIRRLVRIVLPSAAPYLMTALRLASSIALILSVTAELIVGSDGLGERIASAQAIAEYSEMYAFILLTGVLGIVLNAAVRALDARVVWWSVDRQVARP